MSKNCINYCMAPNEVEQDYEYCPHCGLIALTIEGGD